VWNLPSVESSEKVRKILVVTVSSVTAYISEELTANRDIQRDTFPPIYHGL